MTSPTALPPRRGQSLQHIIGALVQMTRHSLIIHLFVFSVVALSICVPAKCANLLSENFDELTLGPIVTIPSEVRNRQAWTPTAPTGWIVDKSGMPANV